MKIDNLLLNNFLINNKEETFVEGYVFKGKILELIENLIIIDVKGQGRIQAKLDTNIKISVGEEVSFLVESLDNDKVMLKPLIRDKLQGVQLLNKNNENSSISNLLKNLNIKETKLTTSLIENLMRYNAPITEQNLTEGIRTLEKLFQLCNLKDEEKVVLLNQTNDEKQLTVDNEIESINENFNKSIDFIKNKELIVQQSSHSENILPEKIDIKSLLVINQGDTNENKDVTQLVKEFLGREFNIDSKDEYIKIISFFLKNNIKTSLNNIRNLRDFNKDPIEFISKIQLIDKTLNVTENNDNIKIFSDNAEIFNGKSFDFSKDDKLVEIQKNIKNLEDSQNPRTKEELRNLNNKIDFLREMNKDLSFVFLPINYRKKEISGILTLIKENKKKKINNEKTNIYINVETQNLGNIKVSCQLISNSISLRMNIKNEDLELFKSTEKQLIEKISLIGYSLDKIEFVVDSNIHVIDTIVSNQNPTYILDLKV